MPSGRSPTSIVSVTSRATRVDSASALAVGVRHPHGAEAHPHAVGVGPDRRTDAPAVRRSPRRPPRSARAPRLSATQTEHVPEAAAAPSGPGSRLTEPAGRKARGRCLASPSPAAPPTCFAGLLAQTRLELATHPRRASAPPALTPPERESTETDRNRATAAPTTAKRTPRRLEGAAGAGPGDGATVADAVFSVTTLGLLRGRPPGLLRDHLHRPRGTFGLRAALSRRQLLRGLRRRRDLLREAQSGVAGRAGLRSATTRALRPGSPAGRAACSASASASSLAVEKRSSRYFASPAARASRAPPKPPAPAPGPTAPARPRGIFATAFPGGGHAR